MKTCPVCNSRCFDDMDTCYGCMYSFKNNDKETKSSKKSSSSNKKEKTKTNKLYNPKDSKNFTIEDTYTNKHVPEYFELEPFAYVEEDDAKVKTAAHAKATQKSDEDIVVKIKIPKSILEKYMA